MRKVKISPTQCFGVLMMVWGIMIIEENSVNFLREESLFNKRRNRMLDLAMARGMDQDVAEKIFVFGPSVIQFVGDMGFNDAT